MRITSRVCHAILVATLLAAAAGVASAQTYFATPALAIPDGPAAGLQHEIAVVGGPGSINSVAVAFDITHPATADLDIFLLPPGVSWPGALTPAQEAAAIAAGAIELTTDNGAGANYTNTVFTGTTDPVYNQGGNVAQPIGAAAAPFTGIFLPEDTAAFNALYGTSANGVWALVIIDDTGGNIGALDGWAIEFALETSFDAGPFFTVHPFATPGNNSVVQTFWTPTQLPGGPGTIVAFGFVFQGGNAQIYPDVIIRMGEGTVTGNGLNFTFATNYDVSGPVEVFNGQYTIDNVVNGLTRMPLNPRFHWNHSDSLVVETRVNGAGVGVGSGQVGCLTAGGSNSRTWNDSSSSATTANNPASPPAQSAEYSVSLAYAPDAQPLSGFYTINRDRSTNPSFTSIGQAFDTLEALGVSGPVTLRVFDDGGPYTADPSHRLDTFSGMGPANPVTVEAAPGESPLLLGGAAIAVPNGGNAALMLRDVANVTIRGLEFDGMGTDDHGVAITAAAAPGNDACVIERCNIHGYLGQGVIVARNSVGVVGVSNAVVVNNFVWDCGAAEIGGAGLLSPRGVLWCRDAEDARIVHNTLVMGSTGTLMVFRHDAPTAGLEVAEFSNNIIYSDVSGTALYSYLLDHPLVANGNCWHTGGGVAFGDTAPMTTFALWQGGGYDANGVNADPQLMNPAAGDLHIPTGSPGHNAAVALAPAVNVDIDGDSRPIGASNDIGADETNVAPGPEPDIDVQRPAGTPIADGGSDDIGNQPFGVNIDLVYTITNTGNATLNLTGGSPVSTTNDSNVASSVQAQPALLAIPQGGMTTFTVRINVSSGAAFSFDIDVASDDPNEGNYDIAVSGMGVSAPEIEVRRLGVEIASGAVHNVNNRTTGATVSFDYTVNNLGNAALSLPGVPPVMLSGAVNVTAAVMQQPPAVVAVGGVETLTIEITPTADGAFSVLVTIVNDDADENPYTFTISGSGVTGGGGGGGGGGCCSVEADPTVAHGNLLLALMVLIGATLLVARRRRPAKG